MDPVLAKALKKKEKLERQLSDIERFITLHRRFSGAVKNDESLQSVADELPRATLRRPNRPAVYIKAIEHVLRRTGKPLTRAEIVEALAKDGVTIPSADPVRYVGTILWRGNKIFENNGDGYWLKGVRVPRTPDEIIELAAPLSVGGNRT
jgi:hypothetical protein